MSCQVHYVEVYVSTHLIYNDVEQFKRKKNVKLLGKNVFIFLCVKILI